MPLGKYGMSENLNYLKNFWKNKKIFITGHNGFKGSWLTIFFNLLGAKIYGYSLKKKKLSFFNIAKLEKIVSKSIIGDVRNHEKLKKAIKDCSPDYIIHMAAQPLVRFSYDNPKYTYEVNSNGTLNILEIVRQLKFIKNILIITTDKVYKNNNNKNFFSENDELGGEDPYSNSKTCAEMICNSYVKSFFLHNKISCVTARAGNVIGGGDFAPNRIIPDFFRALNGNKSLFLRYPNAIRPWQHVIEPLYGYILLLMHTSKKESSFGSWNFGPRRLNNIKVKKVVNIINKKFNNSVKIKIKSDKNNVYKESEILKLNSKKSFETLGWKPKYNIFKTLNLISDWQQSFFKDKKNILDFTKKQIINYINQF